MGKKCSRTRDYTWILVVLVISIGLALSFFLLFDLNQNQADRDNSSFAGTAQSMATTLASELALSRASVGLLAGLFRARIQPTPEEFEVFTEPILEGGTIHLVSRIEVIKHAQRNATVERVLDAYPSLRTDPNVFVLDFKYVTAFTIPRVVAPEIVRPSYIVNTLVAPFLTNTRAVLFNVNSTASRQGALNASAALAEPRSSALLSLPFQGAIQYGFQFIVPYYNSSDTSGVSLTVEERTATIAGFANALFTIPNVINKALRVPAANSMRIFVYDYHTDAPEPVLIHLIEPGGISVNVVVDYVNVGLPVPTPDYSKVTYEAAVTAVDRDWRIVFVNEENVSFSAAAIVVFVILMLFTILMIVVILLYRQLRRSYDQTARVLAQLRVLYDGAPVGMAFVDRQNRFANINAISAALDCASVEDHLGQKIDAVGTAAFAAMAGERIEYVFTTGDTIRDAEVVTTLPPLHSAQQVPYGNQTGEGDDSAPVAMTIVQLDDDDDQYLDDNNSDPNVIPMRTLESLESPPPRTATYLMSLYPVFFTKDAEAHSSHSHSHSSQQRLKNNPDCRGSQAHIALPDGVSIVLKDVSDLSQERNKAREHDESKTLFLARMSHEIRTPLNGILGAIDILLSSQREQQLTLDQQSLVGVINHCSRMLMTLINDILDTSKMEADKLQLNLQPDVVVNHIVFSVDMCQPLDDVSLAIFVDLNTSDALVMCDGTRVSQIIFNLVSNAVKFTKRGHVHVALSSVTSDNNSQITYRIEVLDTGEGIAKEKLSSIFNPFVQEDESNSRTHGGVGLGLAIVWRLVQLMNGTIEVMSEPGKGSTFVVTLPCAVVPESESARAARLQKTTAWLAAGYETGGQGFAGSTVAGSMESGGSSGHAPLGAGSLTELDEAMVELALDQTVLVALKGQERQTAALSEYLMTKQNTLRVDCPRDASELFEIVNSSAAKEYTIVIVDAAYCADLFEMRSAQTATTSLTPTGVKPHDTTKPPLALSRQDFGTEAVLFWCTHPNTRLIVTRMMQTSGFDGVLSNASELVPVIMLQRAALIVSQERVYTSTRSESSGNTAWSESSHTTPQNSSKLADERPICQENGVCPTCKHVMTTSYGVDADGSETSQPSRSSSSAERLLSEALGNQHTLVRTTAHSSVSLPAVDIGDDIRVRVMLVEDNVVNQRIVSAMLARILPSHVILDICDNGQIGVDTFQSKCISSEVYLIIFMDVQMPVLDGFGAASKIREVEAQRRLKRTPIVALTAHAMASDRNACLISGMDDYLTKPTSMKEIGRVLTYFDVPVVDLAAKDMVAKAKGKLKKKKKSGAGTSLKKKLSLPETQAPIHLVRSTESIVEEEKDFAETVV